MLFSRSNKNPGRASIRRTGPAATPLLALALLLGLGGCGGGGNNNRISVAKCQKSTCTPALVTLTASPGEFAAYIVNISSLELQTADGTKSQFMPIPLRVDLAHLGHQTEIVSAADVLPGTYVSGKLVLDYASAGLYVYVNGVATVASAVDSAAITVGKVTLEVTLDPAAPLVVTEGGTNRLALDIDLRGSNSIGSTTSGTTTTYQVVPRPAVAVSTTPAAVKEVRVRGWRDTTDATAGTLRVFVNPLHANTSYLGKQLIHTSAQTVYDINGVTYTGSAGLTAVDGLSNRISIQSFGSLQADGSLVANRIFAGTSLVSSGADDLIGTVIARTADSLKLRGVELSRRDGSFGIIATDVTVTLADATLVTRQDGAAALTKAAISVGQRIEVLGTLTQDSTTSAYTLSAITGKVRQLPTYDAGFVNTGLLGSLTANLQSISGLSATAFNFAGTGTATAENADPANYEVDLGSLDASTLAAGEPVLWSGYVPAFGVAPPDFTATSLTGAAAIEAALVVRWSGTGSTAPFSALNSSGIVVNLGAANLGTDHYIEIGPQKLDLAALPASPQIVAASATSGEYVLRTAPATVKVFSHFADFVTQLTSALNGTTHAVTLTAAGDYDSGTNAFTATRVVAVIDP
jgi:hypothetical protein